MNKRADILIVGTGVAGLYCALNFPKDKNILIITKASTGENDSYLAQGGICVLRDEDDYDSFFQDTMKAGHYKNNRKAVETMIRNSPEIIKDLIAYGVEFERKNGKLVFTREGAHSKSRILYHDDITGKEIFNKLLKEVKERKNIEIMENRTMIDIISQDNTCRGIVAYDKEEKLTPIEANYVVFASGGLGGLYEHSTNYKHLTGDAIAISIKNRIEVENMNYIQFHPTAFYSKEPGRKFLISESVRGEGALLYNKNMERFVDELLPRDLVSQAIERQKKIDKRDYVWLSMKHMDGEKVKERFPNIYKYCLENGYDITKEAIPVTPAQHYMMGGIKVDLKSKTSMNHLYAIGETSCNGVHGANRLASNSLLESLVFARLGAMDIRKNYKILDDFKVQVDLEAYGDLEKLRLDYKETILEEIGRESCN